MTSIPTIAGKAEEIISLVRESGNMDTKSQRAIRIEVSRLLKDQSAETVYTLAFTLIRTYGLRFIPYELIRFHGPAFTALTPDLLEQLGAGFDSWNAVDSFARTLSGPAWQAGLITSETIHAWAQSPNIWWRRAALVSTVAWNVRSQGGKGNSKKTLAVCEMLKCDRQPVIVKALSWALRELIPHDPAVVREFIENNRDCLAAQVLREVNHKLETGLKNPPSNCQLLPWEIEGWQTEVNSWIQDVLALKGIKAAGPIQEVQRRPWSILLRASTPEGNFYCKVCSPVLQHEPGLTRALAGWLPGHILPPIAIDPLHGWMLMPDGGPTLRSRFEAGADSSLWLSILPVYAGMQIEMVEHNQELLDLGIIDRRLTTLSDQFEALLADTSALRVGRKDGLTTSEFEKLKNEIPLFRVLCSRLADYGIPETLQHDDFHDGNIFYSDDRPVFFDWGECCLAHPFFSMVVGLNSISYRFNLHPGDAQWTSLRDAYLAPWEVRFERQRLLAAFDLAMQLGAVNRALTWHRVVSSLPLCWKRQNTDAVPGWLQEYIQRLSTSAALRL